MPDRPFYSSRFQSRTHQPSLLSGFWEKTNGTVLPYNPGFSLKTLPKPKNEPGTLHDKVQQQSLPSSDAFIFRAGRLLYYHAGVFGHTSCISLPWLLYHTRGQVKLSVFIWQGQTVYICSLPVPQRDRQTDKQLAM